MAVLVAEERVVVLVAEEAAPDPDLRGEGKECDSGRRMGDAEE